MLKFLPIIGEGKGWYRNWMMKEYRQRTACKYLGTRTYKVWTTTALCRSLNNNKKNISNILSGYPGVPGPSGYQVGISSALSLNAIKTVLTGIENTAALDSFPRRFNSGRSFYHCCKCLEWKPHFVQKSSSLCYWIKEWLNETLSYLLISYLDL